MQRISVAAIIVQQIAALQHGNHPLEKILEQVSGTEGHPDYSNEEYFLLVRVNDGEPKKVFRGLLEGSGRGANPALSRMVLGAELGLGDSSRYGTTV